MMSKSKKFIVGAVALLCARLVSAADVATDVISQSSSDAIMVVKIASLDKTSVKVAKLAKDFGVDAFFPPIADPLAALKQQMKIEKGINDAGDAGIEVFQPDRKAGQFGPGMVLMIPVSNYAEFLTNFEGAEKDGNLSVVHFAGEPGKSFVADWGSYAAISNIKTLVENKPSNTVKTTGAITKEIARQDFVFYFNMVKVNEVAGPEMERDFGRVLTQFDRDAKNDIPEKWIPTVRALVSQGLNVLKTTVKDADAASIGLNISDTGINATVVGQFKPDTYGAKLAGDIKNTDRPLTVGIPNGKFFYYGGADLSSPAIVNAIDDFTKPVVAELNKVEGQEKAQKLTAAILDSARTTKGFVFGMPVPSKIGEEALFQQIAVYDTDSKKMSDVMTGVADLVQPLLAGIKMPGGQGAPKLVTDSPAKTIEGVSFTNWKLDLMPNKEDPNAMQMENFMNLFYGPDGLTYSFGAPNASTFVFANCATDENITKFMKSYAAKEENLSKLDQVKVVTDSLPKSRMLEAYVSLDEIVNAGVAVAASNGVPVQVQLPPDLPPIGFTFGTEGSAFRFDSHIPTSTMQSIIAAGMQVFAKMNQPRQGNL